MQYALAEMDKKANASYWFGKDETKGTLASGTSAFYKAMTAEEVIQRTHYPKIDLIAVAPNLLVSIWRF